MIPIDSNHISTLAQPNDNIRQNYRVTTFVERQLCSVEAVVTTDTGYTLLARDSAGC